MKKILVQLISSQNDVSHKRIISLLSFLVLIGMLIGSFFKLPVNEPLMYVFAGLSIGQSSLSVAEKFNTQQ